jgi:cytochrome c
MTRILSVLFATTLALPAFADGHTGPGDIEAGEKQFGKCKTCHSIVDDAGETIQKGGKIGPNLYGVIGRQAGSVEDFRYGDDLVKVGEEGLVWDAALIAEYVKDPKAFLAKTLDDKKARSKMAFKLAKGGEDVAAYLASVAPAPEADAASGS